MATKATFNVGDRVRDRRDGSTGTVKKIDDIYEVKWDSKTGWMSCSDELRLVQQHLDQIN